MIANELTRKMSIARGKFIDWKFEFDSEVPLFNSPTTGIFTERNYNWILIIKVRAVIENRLRFKTVHCTGTDGNNSIFKEISNQ